MSEPPRPRPPAEPNPHQLRAEPLADAEAEVSGPDAALLQGTAELARPLAAVYTALGSLVRDLRRQKDLHSSEVRRLQAENTRLRTRLCEGGAAATSKDQPAKIVPSCAAGCGSSGYPSCEFEETDAFWPTVLPRATTDIAPRAWEAKPWAATRTTTVDECGGVRQSQVAATAVRRFYAKKAEKLRAEVHAQPPKRTKKVFVDQESMKEKVRKIMLKPEYDPTLLYHQSGFCQAVLRSSSFDAVTQTVIFLNAVWLGIDADHNQADVLTDADAWFQVVEQAFTVFFFTEWLMRLLAFKDKLAGFKDGWYVLDTLLVAMMVCDNWLVASLVFITRSAASDVSAGVLLGNSSLLRLLRIVRILRMARMARLLRMMPEVMVMIRAMLTSVRSVCIALSFLGTIDYIFAVAFTQMARGTLLESLHFPSVLGSMHTLLIAGAFPDTEGIMRDTSSQHFFYWVGLILYILLTTITIMNMMIGLLVEVVKCAQHVEQEALDCKGLKDTLLEAFGERDPGEIIISKERFWMLLEDDSVLRALQGCSIDIVGLVELVDFIFLDDKTLDLGAFIEVLLQLRSSNTATVKDLVDLRKFVVHELSLSRTSKAERCEPLATDQLL